MESIKIKVISPNEDSCPFPPQKPTASLNLSTRNQNAIPQCPAQKKYISENCRANCFCLRLDLFQARKYLRVCRFLDTVNDLHI